MKTIVFVRHAKSSWTDFRLTDFDRPLDERGIKDAPFMALKLKSSGVHAELIISSPANRALTTANVFAEQFGCPVITDMDLYHGFPENYMNAIRSITADIHTVALFGHNPGLTVLTNMIHPEGIDNLPTCGVVIAKVPGDKKWNDVTFEDLQFVTLLYPKM
jgi:phosphohistidine phosphatase